jgi:hypothetical protein
MILDKALQLSNEQAVTASAASTNYIDQLTGGDAYEPVFAVATVTQDFATLTSLTIDIQTADDAAFTSPITLLSSGAIPVADLKAGAEVFKARLPFDTHRYVRAYYTVTGSSATAGKVSLNMTKDVTIDA